MDFFLHPSRFRSQFLGLVEQIRDVYIVNKRALE